MLLPDSKRHPQSLPVNEFPMGTARHAAYEECRHLEARAAWDTFAPGLQGELSESMRNQLDPPSAARVLGYALLFAPAETGSSALAVEINKCKGDEGELLELAHLLVYALVRIFYNPKGRIPTLSAHHFFEPAGTPPSSTRPFPRPVGTTPAKLRTLVHNRDQPRCVFTGEFDSEFAHLRGSESDRCSTTVVAHIISHSVSTSGAHAANKDTWVASTTSVIEQYGGFRPGDVLGSNGVDSPLNALTAGDTAHHHFDNLELWLTPTEDKLNPGHVIPNTYDICHSESLNPIAVGLKKQVTFNDSAVEEDGSAIPPPHAQLLGHAGSWRASVSTSR